MSSTSPSNKELFEAVTKLRPLHPHLARAKLLSLLKDDYSWTLSEQRLKKCLDGNNLNARPGDGGADLPRDEDFQLVVKNAFNDFKVRERNFLLALSKSQCRKVSDDEHTDPLFAASHQRHHIEFLLVLKEIKPCVLVAHSIAQEIFTEMVRQCLIPVVRDYHLARYGFRLHPIRHPMPTTIHHGFQNGWIFADTRSDLWPEVNKLFLTASLGETDEKRIGVALGYPTVSGDCTFCAIDYTEMNDLRIVTRRNVSCVSAYEFDCAAGSEHYNTLMTDFDRCARAADDVGTKIGMDLGRHEELATWVERSQRRV